ncbi:MAG: O-antigen ligase family protein [Ilumatobacteraceae bacterium]
MSTIVDIDPPPDRRRTVGQTARLAVPIVYLVALYLVSPRFALSALQLTLAQLVGLAALVLWMLDRLSNHNARIHSRVTRALGVVVVTMAASYAIGLSRPLLAPQIEAADRSLVRLLSLAGAALLIAGVIRRRSDLDHFLVLLSAGALVLASAAALQALAGVDIAPWFRPPGFLDRGIKQTGLVERFGLTRASGLATHPIELGTTLAALLPITLHVAAFGRTQRHRGLASAATAMVLLALLLSISRSAFVGLFIALVAVVPFMESTRRFRLMIMAVVAIGSAFMIVPERAQAGFQLVADWRGESTDGGSNLEARTEDYTRVREAVLLHPLEGTGFGTNLSAVGPVGVTDNQYLDHLVETGIIGVSTWIALMLTSVSSMRRTSGGGPRINARDDLAQASRPPPSSPRCRGGMFDAFAFRAECVDLLRRVRPRRRARTGHVGETRRPASKRDHPGGSPSSTTGRPDEHAGQSCARRCWSLPERRTRCTDRQGGRLRLAGRRHLPGDHPDPLRESFRSCWPSSSCRQFGIVTFGAVVIAFMDIF